MTNVDDYILIKKISEGDSKSFESLMLKYQRIVYGYIVKMLKDKHKSEDFTQETWIKVIKGASSFKTSGSAKSWILSIARNLVIDEFRQNKKWVHIEDEKWESFEDPQSDLEALFVRKCQSEELSQAFDCLTENQKIILSMILIEELSQSEVSVKLGISVGAVKASLFRAREQLKKYTE